MSLDIPATPKAKCVVDFLNACLNDIPVDTASRIRSKCKLPLF